MMDDPDMISIAEVAQRTGLKIEAIRKFCLRHLDAIRMQSAPRGYPAPDKPTLISWSDFQAKRAAPRRHRRVTAPPLPIEAYAVPDDEDFMTAHEIASRLGISLPAVHAFHQRHCEIRVKRSPQGKRRPGDPIRISFGDFYRARQGVRIPQRDGPRGRDRKPTKQEIRTATELYADHKRGDAMASDRLLELVGSINGGITIGHERVYRDVHGKLRVIPNPGPLILGNKGVGL